ncbi:hypothetical protein HPB48_005177 [Haemaphysalis longicornis]|uniref:poly(A)-specific ribonuclease n=1 Tax=Haemaphysalis longicornis TaxID=44386 RepID=A0A9J6F7B6_HAELO|nr:hypothetical protein HPB48_005177 [Haemaphysalis longicornis]
MISFPLTHFAQSTKHLSGLQTVGESRNVAFAFSVVSNYDSAKSPGVRAVHLNNHKLCTHWKESTRLVCPLLLVSLLDRLRSHECELARTAMASSNVAGTNAVTSVDVGSSVLAVPIETPCILNVWAFNLDEELKNISRIVKRYEFVAMDTEFPGRQTKQGIDTYEFAQLLTLCGVVLSKDVKLICFHGAYDVAYLLRLLTNGPLTQDISEFIEVMRLYFPVVYDVKHLAQTCTYLKGGLKTMADKLELEKIGRRHQAGSDSLLTGEVFFKIREIFFEGEITNAKLCGPLVGLDIP